MKVDRETWKWSLQLGAARRDFTRKWDDALFIGDIRW
jgi:hypothetical protein